MCVPSEDGTEMYLVSQYTRFWLMLYRYNCVCHQRMELRCAQLHNTPDADLLCRCRCVCRQKMELICTQPHSTATQCRLQWRHFWASQPTSQYICLFLFLFFPHLCLTVDPSSLSIHPDIIVTVDWASKPNFLPSSASACGHQCSVTVQTVAHNHWQTLMQALDKSSPDKNSLGKNSGQKLTGHWVKTL